jgi:putative transposase
VLRTHSRPYTSTDNPYSEAQFKTLKYRPEFPDRFDSIEHARAFCRLFFPWYNHEHRHSGIGLMAPAAVHHGRAKALHAKRAGVLDAAYAATPERFVRCPPRPPALPTAAWINKPASVVAQAPNPDEESVAVLSPRPAERLTARQISPAGLTGQETAP